MVKRKTGKIGIKINKLVKLAGSLEVETQQFVPSVNSSKSHLQQM